jgi:hypothetical protein
VFRCFRKAASHLEQSVPIVGGLAACAHLGQAIEAEDAEHRRLCRVSLDMLIGARTVEVCRC